MVSNPSPSGRPRAPCSQRRQSPPHHSTRLRQHAQCRTPYPPSGLVKDHASTDRSVQVISARRMCLRVVIQEEDHLSPKQADIPHSRGSEQRTGASSTDAAQVCTGNKDEGILQERQVELDFCLLWVRSPWFMSHGVRLRQQLGLRRCRGRRRVQSAGKFRGPTFISSLLFPKFPERRGGEGWNSTPLFRPRLGGLKVPDLTSSALGSHQHGIRTTTSNLEVTRGFIGTRTRRASARARSPALQRCYRVAPA